MREVAFLIVGGVLLYFGAEWLVRGSAGLASKLRVRQMVIGLTVVAYGTSAPELVVGVRAALAGRSGIAFGNVVGSNIANIGLILGITALISPPLVDEGLRRREVPALLVTALMFPLLIADGRVSRIEGAGLVLAAVAYTIVMLRGSRATVPEAAHDAEIVSEAAAAAARMPKMPSPVILGLTAFLGLLCLLGGAELFVDGASGVARSLGVPERLIGLTIVAVGTSVPELATSVVAARRGHSDIAVGNVVGSNILNALGVLGASAFAAPLNVTLHEARLEVCALIIMTLAAGVVLREGRRLTRAEGAVLLVGYLIFLVLLGLWSRRS